MNRHEKSLLGKRARLASESPAQEEYVTEADKARRLLSNLRSPINMDSPTVANEVWRQAEFDAPVILRPATRTV